MTVRARIGRILAIFTLLATAVAIAAGNDVSESPLWVALLSWFVAVAAIIVVVAAMMSVVRPVAWRIVAALAALYCLACVTLVIFQLGSPLGLDVDFVLASLSDSAKTLVKIIGWPATILLMAVVAGIVQAYAASLASLARPLSAMPRFRRMSLWSLCVLLPVLALLGLPHVHLRAPDRGYGGANIRPTVAALQPSVFTRGESVFLLQLESINGLLASDEYVLRGMPVARDPMPAMRQIARKGVFFPSFWGNTVTTHRAQETILCGAVRNLHDPYFDQLVPWDGDCLPALLSKAGYKTVFLSSYPDRSFGSTGSFMKRAGFTDVRFADELMKTGDLLYRWGYDEATFYERAFRYLREHYSAQDKLFVYIAVCAHHCGFTRDASDWSFFTADNEGKIRQYLWSQEIQDRSLLAFDRLLRDYTGGKAHALYVPDHSFPLGLYGGSAPSTGATVDNFITPFLYVPPDDRASEFAVGRTVGEIYAQTDLIPTVAELLSDRPHPNSLVPFMKRNPPSRHPYEQCHVMAQPYAGRRLLVARGTVAHEYHVAMQVLREYRILRNPLRQELVKEVGGVTYEEFERLYGCSRYQTNVPETVLARSR